MKHIVIEADIVVPRLELQRQRYEIDRDTVQRLLDSLEQGVNELGVTAEELSDLLAGTGEVSTLVELQAKRESVRNLLTQLAKAAWINDLPWTLDQAEGWGRGEERFHEFVRAYLYPDESVSGEAGD